MQAPSDGSTGVTTALPNVVSYSVNHEDVILLRLFEGRTHGFYVDIGAGHPTSENDTRAFYDRGWNGINVEPNPDFFLDLETERPRDRNLQLAVADRAGHLDYWAVTGTGLSTCDAEEAARAHAKGFDVRQSTVTCTTLVDIFADAAIGTIDFLKVDVEGFEFYVLKGNDWAIYRPSVIVVEATFPETTIRRPDRVRSLLEQNGYEFRHFDGLNDFFLDRAFQVPADVFRPINVFDRVIPHSLATLREHAANLEAARLVQDEYVGSLLAHIAQLEREREDDAAERAAASFRDGEHARTRRELLALQARADRDREEAAQAYRLAELDADRLLDLRRELDRALRANASQTASSAQGQQLSSDVGRLVEQNRALEDKVARLGEISARRDERMREHELMLEAVRRSSSWRLTAPVRVVGRLLGRR